jgi:translation initiation factor 3 subunit C
VTRLADEAALMELSAQIFGYYSRVKAYSSAATAALLHIEHIYYKHDSIAQAVQRSYHFNKIWGQYKDLHPASLGNINLTQLGALDAKKVHPAAYQGNPSVQAPAYHASSILEELSHFIFKHGDDRSRARALLCNVYHKALHDNFYQARDIFLISHIQDTVDKMDIKTQILYNRTLVTLGLCAFRLGLIAKAHDCLVAICTSRLKELLAQGQGKFFLEKDREQERIERRRQLPYHMHINPDLLECCHLISAMLLELPIIARAGGVVSTNAPGHVISRHFRKYYQGYSRQVFTGPPENTREHILAAAKALLNGEWKKARDLVVNLESWNLLPGDGAEKARSFLRVRIKEEGVRIYLLTYGSHFESMSLAHLCEMFEMEESLARKIVSKMIFDKEISAAWEHPADTLILYKVDPSTIQSLSQSVAEKIGSLMESNERLLDPFSGMYGYKDDNQYNRDNRNKQYDNDKQSGRNKSKSSNYARSNQLRMLPGRGMNRSRGSQSGGRNNNSNAWASGRKPSFNDRGGARQGNFEQSNPQYNNRYPSNPSQS